MKVIIELDDLIYILDKINVTCTESESADQGIVAHIEGNNLSYSLPGKIATE